MEIGCLGLLRIGGFGVLINEILELGLRVLRERNGRAEKLQEMRVVLANMLGQGYGEIHTILIYTEWSLVAHLNGVVSATVKTTKSSWNLEKKILSLHSLALGFEQIRF